jgi:hypothetical protein
MDRMLLEVAMMAQPHGANLASERSLQWVMVVFALNRCGGMTERRQYDEGVACESCVIAGCVNGDGCGRK